MFLGKHNIGFTSNLPNVTEKHPETPEKNTRLFHSRVLIIVIMSIYQMQIKPRQNRRQAQALILSIEHLNTTEIKIQMQVEPDRGRNFSAEIRPVLSVEITRLKEGSRLLVTYDLANRKDLVYSGAV